MPEEIRTPDPHIRSLALRDDFKAAYADEHENLGAIPTRETR
jgi:hypothetical protein